MFLTNVLGFNVVIPELNKKMIWVYDLSIDMRAKRRGGGNVFENADRHAGTVWLLKLEPTQLRLRKVML